MSGQVRHRELGETGLSVSRIGIGLAELGYRIGGEETARAAEVLNSALDSGINFLDTAGCYGVSERLIGDTVSTRRDEYVLASKTGHMSDGCGDGWSFDCVLRSIERSLERMKTDHIDIMLLHTCDLETLERGEAVRALEEARVRGLVDFLGYSGDNDAAVWAAESGSFDVIETSFNLADQGARRRLFGAIREYKLGLIAKRPIANGVWGRDADPDVYGNGYGSEYHRRQIVMRESPLPNEPGDPILASLGFTLAHDEVTVAIVGSINPGHIKSNIAILDDMPVDPRFVEGAHKRFDEVGGDWQQLS